MISFIITVFRSNLTPKGRPKKKKKTRKKKCNHKEWEKSIEHRFDADQLQNGKGGRSVDSWDR